MDRRWVGALLVASGLAPMGCGAEFSNAIFYEDAEFLAALPQDTLTVDVPSSQSSTSQSLSTSSHLAPLVCSRWKAEECDPDSLRQLTSDVASQLNGYVRNVLTLLDTIRQYPPSVRTEDTREWGPWLLEEEAIFVRLEVVRSGEDYTYQLTLSDAKESPGDSVLWGEFAPGSTAVNGEGQFTFDFNVQHAYAPNETLLGVMEVTYRVADEERDLDATLTDIRHDGETSGRDASYAWLEPGDGSGFFFVSTEAEFYGDTTVSETLSVWSTWEPSQRGRSDSRMYGGDLGSYVGGAVECWNSAQEPVYYYDASCTGSSGEGDPSQCLPSPLKWNDQAASLRTPQVAE